MTHNKMVLPGAGKQQGEKSWKEIVKAILWEERRDWRISVD
jgi:hypothetical protein